MSLQEFINYHYGHTAETRPYVGRGSTKECLGVVIEANGYLTPGLFLLELGNLIGEHNATLTTEKIDYEVELPLSVKVDNMGLDLVVYFPDISYVDDYVDDYVTDNEDE